MASAIQTVLLLFTLCDYVVSINPDVIYIDSTNGLDKTSCLFGKLDTPCKSLSFANKGLHPNTRIAFIQPSSKEYQRDSEQPENNCSTWMFRNETTMKCECSDIPHYALHCDADIPQVSILDCYCLTYDIKSKKTELGLCFFGCDRSAHDKRQHGDPVYTVLPQQLNELNTMTCGKANRTSTLCGECKPGLSPLVYSYDLTCMNCTGMTYNWIKYIAVAYIPLTAFFFLVVIFGFSGTNPLMRAFISISQGLASPIMIRALLRHTDTNVGVLIKVLGSIYGVFNLDFFGTILPPICLDITLLQALTLDYLIALYPLLLIMFTFILIRLHSHDVRIIVWLWKPFHKRLKSQNWDFEGSILKAFATFFLLSYLKLLNVSFDLLLYTRIYTLEGSSYISRSALYLDTSVDYFSKEHIPYAVIAILVMTIVIILPSLFLVVYPTRCFQICLNSINLQRQSVNMFVTCYQGYFKDGTNGTRDYRFFSVLFFLLQISLFGFFSISRNMYSMTLCPVFLILTVVIQLLVQPYQEQFRMYNYLDIIMMLNFALIMSMVISADEASIKAREFSDSSYAIAGVFATFPLLYVIGLNIWWVATKKRRFRNAFQKVKKFFTKKRQFRVDILGSNKASDFPDRIENPQNYCHQVAPAAAPLQNPTSQCSKYGTISIP